MATRHAAPTSASSNVIALFPNRGPAPIGSTNSRRNSLADNTDAHAMVREMIACLKAACEMDKSPARTMGGIMGIAARYGALVSEERANG